MGSRVVEWMPPEVECLVYTFKEGMLAAVAHDLCLRVERFAVTIDEDTGVITARFEAGSLRVMGAMNHGAVSQAALSSTFFPRIEASARDEVLEVGRFPVIAFRSTAVNVDGDTARIEGRLELHGVERPIAFTARKHGQRFRAEIELDQTQFGIRPYRAMMGTLRVKPGVRIVMAVPAK